MSTASKRSRWRPTPPPPPSPKILHFPRIRRTRRKQPCSARDHRINPFLLLHRHYLANGGNLKNVRDRENEIDLELPGVFLNGKSIEMRNRVEEGGGDGGEYGGGGNNLEEEKWMFQAEILRAECNFLRMEREFALKKLQRNRVKTERTLRSAVQTLIAGRKKIFEGNNVSTVLEKEIEDLSEKLEELQRSTRVRDNVVRNCSNFDQKAYLLQRRIGKLGELPEESCLNGLQGLEDSNSLNTSHDIDKQSSVSISQPEDKSTEVDELSKKMEGLSKGMMLEMGMKEEEYGSMLGSATNGIVDSSVSDSKGVVCPNLSSFSTRQESLILEDNRCSGHCRVIVHRIVEQVRAETEQWSQMQEMLERVREEMEELQASHDFWEKRAHSSAQEIQSLQEAVEEWKEKALGYETRVNELELELSVLQEELCKAKAKLKPVRNREAKSKENHNFNESKDLQIIPLGKQLAKERKMLLLQLQEKPKENSSVGRRRKAYSKTNGVAALHQRTPLQDIGNSPF